jgi:hypothetical protein
MEQPLLYLDTARLGRMSAGAQDVARDFTRLAGDEGGSPFLERLLCKGATQCNDRTMARYPALAVWEGIGALRQSLRLLTVSNPALPVLLASRAGQLMKLAARLLFQSCCNVLVTDLDWPPYREILEAECRRANRSLAFLPLADAILNGSLTEDEVVEKCLHAFLSNRCDGLYIAAISNLGIRLPARAIVKALEAAAELRFVVIDGAQDFCHGAPNLQDDYCDLYLTGSHKWLQAYHPLGIAFYGHRRSRSFVQNVLDLAIDRGEFDDPLLRFIRKIQANTPDGISETVNLAPLFSCQGAVLDALSQTETPTQLLDTRIANVHAAERTAAESGWETRALHDTFRTGIVLLQARRPLRTCPTPESLRAAFYDQGIVLTAYDAGLIRLSMPDTPWQPQQLEHLRAALAQVS